jgi:hypothetical protein
VTASGAVPPDRLADAMIAARLCAIDRGSAAWILRGGYELRDAVIAELRAPARGARRSAASGAYRDGGCSAGSTDRDLLGRVSRVADRCCWGRYMAARDRAMAERMSRRSLRDSRR